MNISRINLIAAGTLLLVVISLTTAMIWSLAQLDSSFDKTRDYNNLQTDINEHVSRTILIYLSSGNASLLTDIDKALSQLITEDNRVVALTASGQPGLQDILSSLQSDALYKLREAGKLKKPQELLINNERELLGALSQLREYSSDGASSFSTLRLQYEQLINEMQTVVPALAHSRESYFSSQPRNRTNIEHNLTSLAELGKALEKLPRFGIYTEEENDGLQSLLGNDSSSDEEEQEEIGDLQIQEINSLIRRYTKELSNIEQLYDQKQQAIDTATGAITTLTQELASVQNQLQTQYDQTRQRVYILLVICIALIVITGAVMALLNTSLSRFISQTCQQLNQLSQGELLATTVQKHRVAELQQLTESIASLNTYFAELITRIRSESTILDQLGRDLNSSSDTLEKIVSEQQASTESASVQVQQLGGSYQEVAQNAVNTSEATRMATELAVHGVEEMNNTSDSIQRLADETAATNETLQQLRNDGKEIGEALHIIQSFAEQTNLLALNAAIEAARAGDSGRGFAVVADEVRNLAANTANAASNIEQIIIKLNSAIDQTSNRVEQQQALVLTTVSLADNAKQRVDKIRASIDEINSMSTMIAAATEEQAATTSQISEIINMTVEQSQRSAVEAENNKQYAGKVDHTGSNLMQLLEQLSKQK